MKKIYSLMLGAALVLANSMSVQAQCVDRYATEIFSNVYVVEDVLYGQALAENGTDTVDLLMDIYRPVGDTVTDRPVVIYAHGGSFVGGAKDMADMVAFCTAMAKRGYVAVSISYRLTSQASLINPDNMVKAVMRAVQDGKGAVRFLRRIEAEESDSLGIDGDNIFFGGTSAGGVLGYHLAYMDDTTALPQSWRNFARQLGGLEGNSGSPGYSSYVKAVIGYAGALGDTIFLQPGDQPFMAMHSENDNTVPYSEGFPLGIPTLPTLYGSAAMSVRADNIGVDYEFYSYTGGAHPPHASGQAILDSTILYTAAFVYKYLPCHPDSVTGITNVDVLNTFNVYPNPSTGVFHVEANDAGQALVAEVYNAQGQVVRTINIEGGRSTINLTNEATGLYMLYVRDEVTGKAVSVNKLMLK